MHAAGGDAVTRGVQHRDLALERADHVARAAGRLAAALRAGADGVLLSRKYSEMKLANLRGAGAAIRSFNG